MKIRTKVFWSAFITLIIGITCSIIITANLYMKYIENEVSKLVIKNYKYASLILDTEIKTMERTQIDWTHWDDTYEYMINKDPRYVQDNLGEVTLKQLDLYGMIFIKKDLSILHSDFLEEEDKDAFYEKLNIDHMGELINHISANQINSGLTIINHNVYLLSLAGVTNTKGSVEINGYLLMIRKIDERFINYVKELLSTDISFTRSDLHEDNPSYTEFTMKEIKRSFHTLKSKASITDILNGNVIYINSEGKRISFLNALRTFKDASIVLVLNILAILFVCFLTIHKTVIIKVDKLNQFVDKVMVHSDDTLRVDIPGKDEISNLANNINNMLEKLESNYTEIKRNDTRMHLIMDATSDGFFDYNAKVKKLMISNSWLNYLGYETQDNSMDYEDVIEYIYEKDRNVFRRIVSKYRKEKDSFYAEIRVNKAFGGFIWALVRGKIVDFDNDGNDLRWIGTLSDITKSKEAELENIYLLQTDALTKLKNRSYMEKLLLELEEDWNHELCILMADVNGLKLVNDTFGYKEGDRLLQTIGDIFRICCADTDIPVRWGGDEFLILIYNDRKYADSLQHKIKQELNKIISFPIKVSVAMGYAGKRSTDFNTNDITKRAEEMMYRSKLLESKSIRSGIISSLKQSFVEKNIETLDHIHRLKELCLHIGDKMRFPKDIMDELALLCILHDIGKIALPYYIINKFDELTADEVNLIRTHTESGYRIAKSASEIAHIADKILYHHENYDGTGYPRGLSKDRIPIISRVLSVAHAYDVMVYGNQYRERISKEEALKNINNFSNSKYDPGIVQILQEVVLTCSDIIIE